VFISPSQLLSRPFRKHLPRCPPSGNRHLHIAIRPTARTAPGPIFQPFPPSSTPALHTPLNPLCLLLPSASSRPLPLPSLPPLVHSLTLVPSPDKHLLLLHKLPLLHLAPPLPLDERHLHPPTIPDDRLRRVRRGRALVDDEALANGDGTDGGRTGWRGRRGISFMMVIGGWSGRCIYGTVSVGLLYRAKEGCWSGLTCAKSAR